MNTTTSTLVGLILLNAIVVYSFKSFGDHSRFLRPSFGCDSTRFASALPNFRCIPHPGYPKRAFLCLHMASDFQIGDNVVCIGKGLDSKLNGILTDWKNGWWTVTLDNGTVLKKREKDLSSGKKSVKHESPSSIQQMEIVSNTSLKVTTPEASSISESTKKVQKVQTVSKKIGNIPPSDTSVDKIPQAVGVPKSMKTQSRLDLQPRDTNALPDSKSHSTSPLDEQQPTDAEAFPKSKSSTTAKPVTSSNQKNSTQVEVGQSTNQVVPSKPTTKRTTALKSVSPISATPIDIKLKVNEGPSPAKSLRSKAPEPVEALNTASPVLVPASAERDSKLKINEGPIPAKSLRSKAPSPPEFVETSNIPPPASPEPVEAFNTPSPVPASAEREGDDAGAVKSKQLRATKKPLASSPPPSPGLIIPDSSISQPAPAVEAAPASSTKRDPEAAEPLGHFPSSSPAVGEWSSKAATPAAAADAESEKAMGAILQGFDDIVQRFSDKYKV